MAWGVVSLSQAYISGRVGFYITRALIGAFEGGFAPGAILYLTNFYTGRELIPRLAILNAMIDASTYLYATSRRHDADHDQLSGVLAAGIATGVLQMRDVGSRPGWYWLFLLEGVAVFLLGLAVRLSLSLCRYLIAYKTSRATSTSHTLPQAQQASCVVSHGTPNMRRSYSSTDSYATTRLKAPTSNTSDLLCEKYSLCGATLPFGASSS